MQAPETRTLTDPHPNAAYQAARPAHIRWVTVRGWQLHLRCWGSPQLASPERPPLLLMHGWMDVAASFQFLVDALHALEGASRYIVAADWRGFGLSTPASGAAPDSFWFPDYLADLDALCALLLAEAEARPGSPGLDRIDLLGHSMGGNVVMSYAGLRPQRLRRLVNLEGFGLPRTRPDEAPRRLLQWLDAVQQPATLRSYASAAEVAARLCQNNPLLQPAKADWLARHWARPAADGRWHILADAAHKRPSPLLYQVEEHLALWRQIRTPLLWAEGDQSDLSRWWGQRYPRSEFESRLAVVPQVQRVQLAPCGHMLHHDQPEALAEHLQRFLG